MMTKLIEKGASPQSPSPHHPLVIACSSQAATAGQAVAILLDWYQQRWEKPAAEGDIAYGSGPGKFNPLRDVCSPKEVGRLALLNYGIY